MSATIVVGSGPNGLAAAIELARSGHAVRVIEAEDSLGGGLRSEALTLPGFVHDVCASVHPLALASPFFRSLPLAMEWVHGIPLAHPLDDGRAALLERTVRGTARHLGHDGPAYWRLFEPLVRDAGALLPLLLAPVRPTRHALLLAGFALYALRSAQSLIDAKFKHERARALLAGIAAHSLLPVAQAPSAGFMLTLAILAHSVGWPIPRGGSQRLADALVEHARELGVGFSTGERIVSLAQLHEASAAVLSLTPRQLLAIEDGRLRPGYRRALDRFRYGPGVFKVDYALDSVVPWRARECWLAATVHVGGTFEDIAASEAAVSRGETAERPFVIAAQPTLFDRSRAPAGKHVLWAYCHVPNGSEVDMTSRIEAQIERFAPGFRDRIVARHTMNARQMEAHDASFVGGDINGGLANVRQFLARPILSLDPYRVPGTKLLLCSASTPPGGGVHGMCGYFAARSALRRLSAP
ncbi:MAG: NAD(P)/FAD-dependent oxidoreductase [Chloroflexi bacterium]|nr:MAG: NAD(P)/FAD-dependent oxidoreductase [Chloroflexota bacterium]